jgi:hypothetical protein
MILSDVKAYLQARGQATLSDMMIHFDTDADALRPMLAVWLRKGRVERLSASPDCGSNCNLCAPEATEIYRWKGERAEDQGHSRF